MDRYNKPVAYAVWSKNEDIRFYSTSGGAFYEFAKGIIDEGGVVVGANYNDQNMVEHSMAYTDEELKNLCQSKYVSSSMGGIFERILYELDEGRIVGFCGAPCQVAGLNAFLGKEYDNLFTMDFVCRGMNSRKAYKAWIEELEIENKKRIKKVWFKYKNKGWKSSPTRTRLTFEDGTHKVLEGKQNHYMYGYLTSNLYIRPSCGKCRFKGLPRNSDITFGDFWGVEKEFDDDKGTSLLLVNSTTGKEFLEKIKNHLEFHQTGFEQAVSGNPMFFQSVEVAKKSNAFLLEIDDIPFSKALAKFTHKTLYEMLIADLIIFAKCICKVTRKVFPKQ